MIGGQALARHHRGRRPGAIVLGLFTAATVLAQAPAAEDRDPQAPGELEEVIVSAQRREENLLDVPLAVTSLSGVQLERLGALDLVDTAKFSPNTTLGVLRGSNSGLTAFIRGVGQQDGVAGFEPGVGVYVDDVYYNRPQAAVLDLYNVERIEILRGPQGTLYGRNTIGGAIRYITRRLARAPELDLQARLGNYGMLDAIATAALPLGSAWRIGGSAANFSREGFGDNLNQPGVENYNKEVRAARLALEGEPLAGWFLRLSADWLEDDSDPRQGHRLTRGLQSGAPVLENVFDTRAGNTVPGYAVRARGASVLVERELQPGGRLRGIFALREDDSQWPADFDSLPTVDIDVPTLYENEQASAELQWVFEGEAWNGVAGAYLLDAQAFTVLDNLSLASVPPGSQARPNNHLESLVEVDSWSLFADATWSFAARWSLSGGVRYTSDERTARIRRQAMTGGVSHWFGGTDVVVATPSDFLGSAGFEKLTPRLGLQFLPAEGQNLYLGYREGYRSGGFDPRGLTSATPDANGDGAVSEAEIHAYMSFAPEEVAAWELGWKAALFDRRMDSRLAVFTSDYTDMQIPVSTGLDTNGDGVPDTFVGITSNAARATIRGAEWEGQAILARDAGVPGSLLQLAWALGYLHPGFDEYTDNFGNDLTGVRVFPHAPQWMATTTLGYARPVQWFGIAGALQALVTYAWRDDQHQVETPNTLLDQAAYGVWDLGLSWSAPDASWTASLHGRNLGDEEYRVSGWRFALGREGNIAAFYGNPRQYWLELRYAIR